MSQARHLTKPEQYGLELVKMFEAACDARANVVTINCTENAAEAINELDAKYKIMRICKVEADGRTGKFKITMALREFHAYMAHMLRAMKMTLMIDNSIRTHDGLVVSNDYLNDGKARR